MVTALSNNPGLVAGQVLDRRYGLMQFRGKKGSGAITRGQLCVKDTGLTPDGWKVAPASATPVIGPFAVCMKDAASADTEISLAMGGIQAIVADGTIEVNARVIAATATAGQVITYSASAVTATPVGAEVTSASEDIMRVVGICLGFADNYHTDTPTAPVDGDVAAILMRVI